MVLNTMILHIALVHQKNNNKYRGRGKKTRETKFTVLLANLRGYKSKEHSLKKIMKR